MRQPTAGKAWVNDAVIRTVAVEAGLSSPLETGGALMGYWCGPGEVVITNATGPGPNAIHKRYSFTPDAEFQEAEIARIYEESGRVHTYLGDWHTHPEGSAHLSPRDKRTLRSIAKFADARAPVPIMAIVAGGEPEWYLSVWMHSPKFLRRLIGRGGPVSLRPRIYSDH